MWNTSTTANAYKLTSIKAVWFCIPAAWKISPINSPTSRRPSEPRLRANDAIVEGEVVAVSPRSGKMRDFQTLMQRRRKYDVEAYARKIPVTFFVFDLLYENGHSFLNEPLSNTKTSSRTKFGNQAGHRHCHLHRDRRPAENWSLLQPGHRASSRGSCHQGRCQPL